MGALGWVLILLRAFVQQTGEAAHNSWVLDAGVLLRKALSPLLFVGVLLHIWSMLWCSRINKVTIHLCHMLLF